jgi:GNAT superfamily N-acetyltransferase
VTIEAPALVRPARPDDAGPISGLLAQLGYPDRAANVRARLERLGAIAGAGVFVAEVEGHVSALAAYQVMHLLERDRPRCRITALVVHHDARRHGLAGALMTRVEAVARECGCSSLEVTTHADRRDAAGFYLAFGFRERPRRLIKALG